MNGYGELGWQPWKKDLKTTLKEAQSAELKAQGYRWRVPSTQRWPPARNSAFRSTASSKRSRPGTERPIHRLLGYATPLQGDPYLECAVAAGGVSFENWNEHGARELALGREALGWRLLFQIDSEPDNTFLRQDGGYFYFLIREEALRARRFDEAWGVLQCH